MMKIELHDGPVSTTPAMLQYAHHKLAAALGRFGSMVQSVRVVVRDATNHKGLDTRCSLHAQVSWRGHSVLVAEEHGPDFYAAVQAASKKLKHALRRMVERSRV